MKLQVQVLSEAAQVPVYAHPGDAGCDLIAAEAVRLPARGGRALVGTGLAIAVPEGHGAFVLPRSGLAAKHGVTCSNAPGLIDAGYRGEVRVALINHDPEHDYEINVGDRIAQLVILPVPPIEFVVSESLPEATRGAGGFGSTGK